MKILLINRIHFIGGGADRVYLNTGKLLEDHSYEVAYFSSKNNYNKTSKYSKFFIDYDPPDKKSFSKKLLSVIKYLYNIQASRNLSKLITEFKPDVAHLHLFYGVHSASILTTLKKHKIPIIVTLHDYRLLCPAYLFLDRDGNICEQCHKNKFYNCTLKRCSRGNLLNSLIITLEAYMRKFVIDPLEFVDHFIFVSRFSMNKHIAFDSRYLTKSDMLYNFTDFSISEPLIKGEYFLYYGRLSREKGIITLIDAAIKTNIQLKIIGDGPLKEDILLKIKNAPNIEYLGFKTGQELSELITNCSFVIVPSEWYENNPMTIVEAYSLGKPVIGSKIGGIPELINDDTGLLFESGNIKDLSDKITLASEINVNEYYRLSENCWQFSKNEFSQSTHFRLLDNIYTSFINPQ